MFKFGRFRQIFLKKRKDNGFDICPVNIVMNEICQEINKLFDKDGKIKPNKGKVIPLLLDELNQLEFYKRNAPKSLGREWVKKNINLF